MDNLQYSSNSDAAKNRKPKPKIVSCEVKGRNETKMGKLASIFIAEDVSNVKEYMWHSVIVPSIKTAMCDLLASACDVVTNSFSMMVNGTPMKSAPRNRFGNGRVNYGGYFVQPKNENVQVAVANDQQPSGVPETNFLFPTKEDADMVLQYLMGELQEYKSVTVSDLYDSVGKTADDNWQIQNVGWTDLSRAYVHHTRGGWMLYLPRVRKL